MAACALSDLYKADGRCRVFRNVGLQQTISILGEHSRVPSKLMVRALADALKINKEELERLATADRIRLKFGKIPLELAGKNPELEPLERVWSHLSEEHKADLVAQAQAWARRDRETTKKH